MRLFILGVVAALASCSSETKQTPAETADSSPDGVAVDSAAESPSGCEPGSDRGYLDAPFDDLDRYCVVEMKDGEVRPRAGVTPYDLNTPLFSDYAIKRRAVWIPPGTHATVSDTEAFDFPVGAIVAKSFGFPDDARKPTPKITWIETRVMFRTAAGWKAYTYAWDSAQTKATLKVEGGVRTISFVHTTGETLTANYLVPSANQCKKCHEESGTVTLIGPKAANLARKFTYATGEEDQLAHWAKVGILAAAPSVPKPLPVWDDPVTGTVEQRARAWLDVNCSHCHRAEGGANTTGLFLRYSETEPYRTGACKTPVAAGKATADFQYDVVPGDPDHSILVYRLSSTEPAIAMPEIGRSLVGKEALSLIREWIQTMSGTCAGDAGGG
ncbi:MAG: SO2930 family diheme c-type cytochrome [Polyangiales bacterium]